MRGGRTTLSSPITGDAIFRWVALASLGLAFVRFSWLWIKDLKFYRKNCWNFQLNSGLPDLGTGVEGDTLGVPGATGKPYSNATRVKIGYPFLLLTLVFAIVGAILGGAR